MLLAAIRLFQVCSALADDVPLARGTLALTPGIRLRCVCSSWSLAETGASLEIAEAPPVLTVASSGELVDIEASLLTLLVSRLVQSVLAAAEASLKNGVLALTTGIVLPCVRL